MRISESLKFFNERKKSAEKEKISTSRPTVELDNQKSLTAFPRFDASFEYSELISDSLSLLSVVQEKKPLGCKRCTDKKDNIKLKASQALENVSLVDKDISLVTINEEDSDYENFLKGKSLMNSDRESFFLTIKRIIPSDDLIATRRYGFDGFLLKWNFLNHSDSVSFDTNYNLNHSKVYFFNISEFNYLYMSRCFIPIELFIKHGGNRTHTLLGSVDINPKPALENVGKVFEYQLMIDNKDLVKCYKRLHDKKYGQIVCSYMFNGKVSNYQACVPKPLTREESLESIRSYNLTLPDTMQSSISINSTRSLELKAFQNGLNMVLIRNKALRTTQEEIMTELKERTTWMHEELKWRLTLQEHAILSGDNPNLVKWRQWKDEATSNVKYRPNPNEEFNKMQVAIFEVTIIELQLNPFSRISIDDSIKQIYVEYSFMHYTGTQMETVSIEKNANDSPITFNYLKTFEIRASDKDARLLAEMIKNNDLIVFSIVSEPFPIHGVSQSCVEIGHCQVRIFDLVQNRTNVVTDCFPVYDELDGGRELGKLKLAFGGLLSLRSVALQIMTPENFKIIR